MPTPNEIYIQEKTKTSHKHWESMGIYALHYALREVEIISQYSVPPYKVDAFIPAARIIIEIDEPYHKDNKVNDAIRQKYIEEKVAGCTFIRIDVDLDFYKQIDNVVELIKSKNIPKWTYSVPEKIKNYTGERAKLKNQSLLAAGVYEYIDELINECNDMGLSTSELTSSDKGNGMLSFRVVYDGITLNLIVGVMKKIKFQIIGFAPEIPDKIGITIGNYIRNRYWNIAGYEQACSKEKAFSLLRKIRDNT
jgi:very-short-patch-repair endonuclease